MNELVVQPPTDAEQQALDHKDAIIALARSATITFLEMGRLLWVARKEAHQFVLHMESFAEYVEGLGLPMPNSYSWACRLIGIHEQLALKNKLPAEELLEMGVSNASLLVPLARKVKRLDPEIVAAAKMFSFRHLQEELGRQSPEGETEESDELHCPRCGEQLFGLRRVRKRGWPKGKARKGEPKKEG